MPNPPDAPQSILVVVTRRIGDVLLTTPLLHALKLAWPSARLDVLVFRGTEGILAGNPDVNRVIVADGGSGWRAGWKLARSIWRRYDVALSTSPSDRPTLYAWAAGRWRAGLVEEGAKPGWKKALLSASAPFENHSLHTVNLNLRLAGVLGIARSYEMPLHWAPADEAALKILLPGFGQVRQAVLHPYPKFAYKMWTRDAWVELGRRLQSAGYEVVLTGGPDAEEKRYVEEIRRALPAATDLAGRLSFPQLSLLLTRAACYVGPDTVMTHLAAATGVPTVALFGPSNPMKWGPWPRNLENAGTPYRLRGALQVAGNVALVQGQTHCVPCLQEGCERHVASLSDCLQHLPVERVVEALRALQVALPRTAS
jgi:heptosyltransferase-3